VQQALVGSAAFWTYMQQLRRSNGEVKVAFGDGDVNSFVNPRGGNTRSVFDLFDEEIRRARADGHRVARMGGSITYSPEEIDSYLGVEPGGASFVAKFNMMLVQTAQLWAKALAPLGAAYFMEPSTVVDADLLGPVITADGEREPGLLASMSQQVAVQVSGFASTYGVHRRLVQLGLNDPRWSRFLADPAAQVVTATRGPKRTVTESDLARVAEREPDSDRWRPDQPGRTLPLLGLR
jgi:hypothetical protein